MDRLLEYHRLKNTRSWEFESLLYALTLAVKQKSVLTCNQSFDSVFPSSPKALWMPSTTDPPSGSIAAFLFLSSEGGGKSPNPSKAVIITCSYLTHKLRRQQNHRLLKRTSGCPTSRDKSLSLMQGSEPYRMTFQWCRSAGFKPLTVSGVLRTWPEVDPTAHFPIW